jgi:hypothetical protein
MFIYEKGIEVMSSISSGSFILFEGAFREFEKEEEKYSYMNVRIYLKTAL